MSLPSNMRFLYVVNLILMTTSEIRTNNEMITTATQKDHICERLQHNNGTQFQIMAIGTTSKTILVIANQSIPWMRPMINYIHQPNYYPLPFNNKNVINNN
uniref:Uncharacterized protein LOC113794938 n=1 Tax=Dermatophagoides pteronyssinus TaxID=6956 RepID=A0A6P6Y603_DERPT|nr:uncharacterized protein LOC113794938 [Dermatophagoides pteronyssinus]